MVNPFHTPWTVCAFGRPEDCAWLGPEHIREVFEHALVTLVRSTSLFGPDTQGIAHLQHKNYGYPRKYKLKTRGAVGVSVIGPKVQVTRLNGSDRSRSCPNASTLSGPNLFQQQQSKSSFESSCIVYFLLFVLLIADFRSFSLFSDRLSHHGYMNQ